MKLGTSLRFLYPTGAHTHTLFKQALATMPPVTAPRRATVGIGANELANAAGTAWLSP